MVAAIPRCALWGEIILIVDRVDQPALEESDDVFNDHLIPSLDGFRGHAGVVRGENHIG